MPEEWVKVCDEKVLKNGDLLDFDQGDKKILLARVGGQVFATDRLCTHAYADLAMGNMNEEEKTVTCPLHLSVFKLDTAAPPYLPAEQPLNAYKVEVRDSALYMQ